MTDNWFHDSWFINQELKLFLNFTLYVITKYYIKYLKIEVVNFKKEMYL